MTVGNVMHACEEAIKSKKYLLLRNGYGEAMGYNPHLLNCKKMTNGKDPFLKSWAISYKLVSFDEYLTYKNRFAFDKLIDRLNNTTL